MKIDDSTNITIPWRWAIIIALSVIGGVFGAGGWATWAASTLTEIRDSNERMASEFQQSRKQTEERLSKLEIDSLKMRLCLELNQNNNWRGIKCQLQ